MDIEQKVRTIAKLTADAKALTAEADELKADLRDELEVGTHEFGDYEVTLSPNRRFNAKKALLLVEDLDLDDEMYEKVTEVGVNKKAFEALYPELYAKAQDENAARVSIKESEVL